MSTVENMTEQLEACDYLRDLFADDSKPEIRTVLRHVTASGMSRDISLVIAQGEEIIDITYYAAHAMGDKVKESKGHRVIKVNGAGMDMGFHLVYNLSSVLFAGQERAGYVLKQAWL